MFYVFWLVPAIPAALVIIFVSLRAMEKDRLRYNLEARISDFDITVSILAGIVLGLFWVVTLPLLALIAFSWYVLLPLVRRAYGRWFSLHRSAKIDERP